MRARLRRRKRAAEPRRPEDDYIENSRPQRRSLLFWTRSGVLLGMESASGQLAASMDFIARYGDEERLSAASIRSSRLST